MYILMRSLKILFSACSPYKLIVKKRTSFQIWIISCSRLCPRSDVPLTLQVWVCLTASAAHQYSSLWLLLCHPPVCAWQKCVRHLWVNWDSRQFVRWVFLLNLGCHIKLCCEAESRKKCLHPLQLVEVITVQRNTKQLLPLPKVEQRQACSHKKQFGRYLIQHITVFTLRN